MELSLIFFGNPNSQQNKDNDISLKIIEYNTPLPPPPPCLLQCEAKIIVQWNLCLKHDSFWWYLLVRVLSRILSFEGEVPSGRQVAPKGVWGHATPPSPHTSQEIFWNEYALRCNLVHPETQFWEMLQCVHWPCHTWMIFPISGYLCILWW